MIGVLHRLYQSELCPIHSRSPTLRMAFAVADYYHSLLGTDNEDFLNRVGSSLAGLAIALGDNPSEPCPCTSSGAAV